MKEGTKEETAEDRLVNYVLDYKELPSDSPDLKTMVDLRKKISIELFQVSRNLGVARKNWKKSERKYEILKNQKRVLESEKGTTKADWIARANTEAELEEAGVNEAIYYSINFVVSSTKEILNEMNQRISLVKDEFVRSNYFEAQ